MHHPKAGIDML